MKNMLNKLLLGLLYLAQRTKELLTSLLHKDFITTQVLAGSCLALPYLVTGEPHAVFPLVVFLIMCLIQGLVYLTIMMKTFGLQARVAVSVDIGVMCGATVLALLTVVNLLALSLSCM
jgi:hypothetical protein